MLKLDDIADVLGCSKAAASMVRSGKYDRPNSDLPARYAALVRVMARPHAASRAAVLREVCTECPRQSCDGCRIAEISD
jgi:hypothetical protein